ncbi:unnamed protein product, partial [Durusdinium trenchii]
VFGPPRGNGSLGYDLIYVEYDGPFTYGIHDACYASWFGHPPPPGMTVGAPMPSEGSNDSWSRATAPGPEKTARKPASGGQPDPPPSEPEEPGDEASSTATSEIKSMLRRRMKQEENYRPKSSLGSVK